VTPIWHPLARREVLEAVDFYEHESPGLGRAFLDALAEGVRQATEFPLSGAETPFGERRIVVQRFPYSLLYRPEGDQLLILAVAHQKRRPGYWVGRFH